MPGWSEFLAALALFLISHAVPSRTGLRKHLTDLIGKRPYLVIYSMVSLLLLGWLIVAAGRAPYVQLWSWAPWQSWVPVLVMPFACLLVAFGAGASNPLSIGGRAAGFDPRRPGIAGVTRHPLLWALALWAGAHLLPNGNLAHVILFGIFAGFAVMGMVLIDRRRKRQFGATDWERQAQATSLVPLAALASDRWRPCGPLSGIRFLVAAALYGALLWLHPPLIGVSPLPNW